MTTSATELTMGGGAAVVPNRLDDLLRGLVQYAVIVGFQLDANFFV